MKTFGTTIIAALAAGAYAQVSPSADVVTTVTEYYDVNCTTNTDYTATVTGTIIQTYCPECTRESAAPKAKGILTTYTTIYDATCSTGLQPVTYTVTESCVSASQPRPIDYIPHGFTVVTVPCQQCPNSAAIVTTPVASPSAPASVLTSSAGPQVSTVYLNGVAQPVPASVPNPVAPAETYIPGNPASPARIAGLNGTTVIPGSNPTVAAPISAFTGAANGRLSSIVFAFVTVSLLSIIFAL